VAEKEAVVVPVAGFPPVVPSQLAETCALDMAEPVDMAKPPVVKNDLAVDDAVVFDCGDELSIRFL
jgi:hypothetical protein